MCRLEGFLFVYEFVISKAALCDLIQINSIYYNGQKYKEQASDGFFSCHDVSFIGYIW